MRHVLVSILAWLSGYVAWRGAMGLPLFVRHQILTRFGPPVFTVHDPLTGPARLRRGSSDLHVFRQVMVQREYACPPRQAAALAARYAAILDAGRVPLILDAGANIGLFARHARALFPKARIVCVEPDPGNMAMVRANCADLSDVAFVETALWDRPVRLGLADPGALQWAYAFRELGPEEPGGLPAETIDRILAAHPDAEPFLFKIDIEGAERVALAEGAAFWAHRPAIFIEPHDTMPGHRGTLRGLLRQGAYHDADVVLRGENLLVFPRTGAEPG